MTVSLLIASQLVITLAAVGLMWRRLDTMSRELARVRRLLETLELARLSGAAVRRTRAEPAFAAESADASRPPTWVRPPSSRNENVETPRASGAHARRLLMANDAPEEARGLLAAVTPELGRLITACLAAIAPALAFAFAAPAGGVVATGLAVCAALMLVAVRPLWSAAAWLAAIAAGAWGGVGLALGAAAIAPLAFSIAAVAAGVAGLLYARLRSIAPGAAMALLMSAALLVLAARAGMVGFAGLGFGALAALAALLGASSLRLEGLHVGALAACDAGLYLLSGQEGAAIWFTPAMAWFGALFLAISLVRTPMLGARGLMLAATGAIAPMLAAGSLFASEHALADPRAAAAAFACLALIFAALLAAAAQRNERGLAALRLTAWALAGAALTALSAAAFLALAAPLAAVAMALTAFGLVALDRRIPHLVWRCGAIAAMAGAAAGAWIGSGIDWPPLLYVGVGMLTPAALAGFSAMIAQRRAPGTAAWLETFALTGALVGAALLIRFVLGANGPLGFVEAGAHISAWLAASLTLAARSRYGARTVRRAFSAALGAAALCAAAVAGLLWLTPWWSARPASGLALALFQHQPLGFAAPAMLAWAQWTFWRARGAQVRTRAAIAGASLLTAGFATLEILSARASATTLGVADGISIMLIVLAFALALGVNFAPGVTSSVRGLDFEKYFQRNRRRQQGV